MTTALPATPQLQYEGVTTRQGSGPLQREQMSVASLWLRSVEVRVRSKMKLRIGLLAVMRPFDPLPARPLAVALAVALSFLPNMCSWNNCSVTP